ncbi:hypothetical protein HPB48_005627 [Haemaphysalis longicornis]|uniref:ETS domain-containing protein n=1 Tax=Haemaphysalis longicornis TaxID=44386 RepID=A0A9J6GGM0_HAELO|nr:hypothetical protein HPB48_005627 [Haemaphysalis longicornis]
MNLIDVVPNANAKETFVPCDFSTEIKEMVQRESDSGSTSSSLSTVNERTENLFPYMPHDTQILAKQMPPPMPLMGKKKGRRGRPPIKEAKVRSRAGKGMGKLWEFIRDLLLNPSTNPSLIRWERREDGIFKFVQSDKVAKMWGDRKQNPRMTYEKLSRAMRYVSLSQVDIFNRSCFFDTAVESVA